MKEKLDGKKVFVNAIFESLGLQYITVFTLFLIAPLGILYLFFLILKFFDYSLSLPVIFFIILMCFIFIVLLIVFFYSRKYRVFKIITNDTGISFIGFFKNIYSRWEEVISIETISTFLDKKRIEVKTNKGTFNFPLTMKEKYKIYPKLVMGLEWKWKDSNGKEMPTSLDNCPLYIEIQKHLSNTSIKN